MHNHQHNPAPKSKEEFVSMLEGLFLQSKRGEVIGTIDPDDIEDDECDALVVKAFGRLCVDDYEQVPYHSTDRYGQQTTNTDLYPLDEIDQWPEGLFERLSKLIWWVEPKDRRNILDVINLATGIRK